MCFFQWKCTNPQQNKQKKRISLVGCLSGGSNCWVWAAARLWCLQCCCTVGKLTSSYITRINSCIDDYLRERPIRRQAGERRILWEKECACVCMRVCVHIFISKLHRPFPLAVTRRHSCCWHRSMTTQRVQRGSLCESALTLVFPVFQQPACQVLMPASESHGLCEDAISAAGWFRTAMRLWRTPINKVD